MKMVTGLIERTYGEILFNGASIEADLIAYKRRMGYLPEEPYLYNHLSAAEYLVMVAQLHRVILVFFLALAFACALSLVRQASAIGATATLSFDFVILTTCMMMFTVLGFRAVFPILISLNANWVLRLTHLRPSRNYIIAVRRTLLALAVVPVLATAFLFAIPYRPFPQACVLLAILTLLGVASRLQQSAFHLLSLAG